ncbi:MAG: DASS family sodium-coupled anion symporter [Variibacter sp.]|nr:DASS family sodium-coupled anion symporter [Variibacter sp.]
MVAVESTAAGPGPALAPGAAPPKKTNWVAQNWGLLLAIAALIAVLLLPTPAALPVAGHRMLAVLAFAVIVWMTEAVDYAVSAILVAALMALLLGFAPNPANPKVLMGTGAALTLAFSGFANTALVLVAAALFLAAAMTATGLDRRIALSILSRVGTDVRNVVIGTILVGFVIAFMVPSTTARVACLVPITLGIIAAFGVNKRGAFASMLMITTVQTASIWNVGIKTAAAQNMVAIGFIEKAFNRTITWLEWLMAAAPFGVLMSIALYFVMTRMMPPEVRQVPGGQEGVRQALEALGPMKAAEKKLLAISLTLIGFWATEGILHRLDTSTTTITAVALMFMPGIGIMTWKEAQPKIPWGTVILFGIGISLGTALLQTKGAVWLADIVVVQFGLKQASAMFILAVMTLFLIVIHLGFASATALASAMIPIVIAVLQSVATPGINLVGMTMLLQFVVSFGFILVVNAPQNMVAYGTDTFGARDFVRTGLVLTAVAFALVMALGATYWRWLGYV